MDARVHTARDTEPSKHNEPIRPRVRLSVTDDLAVDIDVDGLGLQHVKMLGRSHTEANVALKVARLVVMSLLARAMLGEVFRRSHDELCFVCWVGHPLRVYDPIKVSIHGG